MRGPGSSDYGRFTNLYTTSTIALDGDAGKLKFYLQHTPHDAWDYDGVIAMTDNRKVTFFHSPNSRSPGVLLLLDDGRDGIGIN